jgi:hypothetical protein
MEISKATVGILVAACVTAGAGGAFLATRGEEPVATRELAVSADPVAGAVDQSEAVVTDTPADIATTSAPVPVTPPVSATPRAAAPRPARNPQPAADPAPRASASSAAIPAAADEAPVIAPIEPPRIVDNDASRTVEPAGPIYDDLVVAADSVIGLEIESAVTSERARVEDVVTARVTRDVRVGDRVAIPAGSRVNGEVTLVERGGKLKDRARLGVRFTSIVLADGTRVPIETETIYRDGDAPAKESAAKIGGAAIGGAILGGILGGAKGAAIGGAVGAGGGSAVVMAGGRNAATLPSGTPVTVRLEDTATVTVER